MVIGENRGTSLHLMGVRRVSMSGGGVWELTGLEFRLSLGLRGKKTPVGQRSVGASIWTTAP